MNSKNLGRLEKVDLREAWSSEASHFTPWLAQEENLALLGETIGIDLELEAVEREVGPFRADILCRDVATDQRVLIENQLERTDHTHLGQLFTYAAGLNAVTIVWIAQRFTEDHRAALDWLNERTDDKINLFGLEIELWRIGDSPFAPKFNIVSQPNGWSRTVQQAAISSGEVSEHKQLQLRFWTAFRDYMESKKSFIRCQKPLAQHWTNHAIGRSGFHLSSSLSSRNVASEFLGPEMRAEMWINGPNAKQHFANLEVQREAIESALGFTLTWYNSDRKASCRIYAQQNADWQNEQLWPQQFEWLKQRLETMHRVLSPIVKNLPTDGDE